MRALFDLLNSIFPMSPELQEYLKEVIEYKEVPDGELILKEGEVCRHIWFLDSGLVRIYHCPDGKDITTWLLKAGDIFIEVESFFKQAPSRKEIIAMGDCRMFGITYAKLQDICKRFPEFLWHRVMLMEHYYALSEQKHTDALALSNEEKYKKFLKSSSELLQTVPAKYLYSYLGMSKATFGRIRDNLAHEE